MGPAGGIPQQHSRRELEDNEDPFERDLDVDNLLAGNMIFWMSVISLMTRIFSFVISRLKNSLGGNTIELTLIIHQVSQIKDVLEH